MRTDRMLKLAEFLENIPGENNTFYMNTWRRPNGEMKHPCGTAACIGGWAEVLFDREGFEGPKDFEERLRQVSRVDRGLNPPEWMGQADDLLGLTYRESQYLFYTERSSQGLKDVTAEMAANVLRDAVRTGDFQWPADDKTLRELMEEVPS